MLTPSRYDVATTVANALDLGIHHPLREPPDHLPQEIKAGRPHSLLKIWPATSV
jgi:hypothetical protein